MSRTLEHFPPDDLSLYFNGTYCLQLSTDRVIRVGSPIEDDGQYYMQTTEGNIALDDLCQYWPETRGYNVNFGGRYHGLYLHRLARRATRRAVSRDAVTLYTPTGGRWCLDDNVAAETYKRDNYCPLSLADLDMYLSLRRRVDSVAVGRRLIYVPSKPRTLGTLFYGTSGVIGSLDIAKRKYTSLCSGTKLERRSAYSVSRLMEEGK